ncbi:MAG: LysM peptidoglycan-binding domain-containing protein [Cellvibrionaceae bacterium]
MLSYRFCCCRSFKYTSCFLISLLLVACNSTSIVDQPQDSTPKTAELPAKGETDARELQPDLAENANSAENKGADNKKSDNFQTTEASVQSEGNQAEHNQELKELSPEVEPVGDLWVRIREGFKLPDSVTQHPDAEKRIDPYRKRLTRSAHLIDSIAVNATPYLHFVVTELTKNDIPLELALLPIVESHYDPFAYSHGRASGLWQFIPGTGKRFGLTQDWWQDERRDVVAATGSAIQYLLYLHNRFDNDWLLAMAAYNAGQGNVSKAIRKNKKKGKATDYWSLDLPKETQHYIPKLLAWRDIVNEPEKYNIALTPIADEAYFAIVDVGSQIDLAEAAVLAEVDIDTIYKLNPAFNRWATDPSPPHDLIVPFSQAEILREKLSKVSPADRMTWRRYIIKKNDSLIKIAKKFNTSASLVAKINGIKGNRIRAGKALLIPSASKESEYYSKSADQRLAKRQQRAPRKNTTRIEHKVASGESLWDIARKYNVGVNSLARWNQMAPRDVLSTNRTLVVWTKKASVSTPGKKTETRKLFYKVRQGDSLAVIASKFKVGINDIKNWNNIAQQKYIQPGQLLTLYVALTDRQLLAN